MATTLRFNLWINVEDIDDDKEWDEIIQRLKAIPGYVDYSFVDSYNAD